MKRLALSTAALAISAGALIADEKPGTPAPAKPAANPPADPAATQPAASAFPDEKAKLSYALGSFFGGRQKGAPSQAPLDFDRLSEGFKTILTNKDASYAMGASMAAQLLRDNIEVDPDQVMAGFREVMQGGAGKLSDADVSAELKKLQEGINRRNQEVQQREAVKNEAEGKIFLDKNRSAEGVQVTQSGLQYKVIEPAKDANAPKPTIEDTVSANYRGTLLDGTEFDKSPDGQPRPFNLRTNIIKGWSEGLQLMPVGSKYRFWVPASLGYGSTPRGGKIKPGDTLVFDIELVRIEPRTSSPQPAATTPPVRVGEKATATTPPIAVEIKDGKPRVTAVTPPVTVEIPPKPGAKPGPKKEGQPETGGTKPAPPAPPKSPK